MDRLLDDLARIAGGRLPRRRMLQAAAGLVAARVLAGVAGPSPVALAAPAAQLENCGCGPNSTCCQDPDGTFRGCCDGVCCSRPDGFIGGCCGPNLLCCGGVCCQPGQVCAGPGVCAATCGAGQVACKGSCV